MTDTLRLPHMKIVWNMRTATGMIDILYSKIRLRKKLHISLHFILFTIYILIFTHSIIKFTIILCREAIYNPRKLENMKTKQEMRQIHKKFNLFHPPRICFFLHWFGIISFTRKKTFHS